MRRATTESDLYPLVDACYEAATSPEAWNGFLALLNEMVGADASTLHLYDATSARGSLAWSQGLPEAALAEYPTWSAKNPHMATFAGRVVTGTVVTNTPVPRAQYLRSEYHNEYLRRHLPVYAATGCCIYSSDSLNVVISADRLATRPEFDSNVGGIWRLLLPHLQRAVAICRKLGEIDLERTMAMDVLDRVDSGVILFSDKGTVVAINEAARNLVAGGDTLSITRQGHLTARGRERARLDTLIRSACGSTEPSLRPAGGAMTVSRDDGLPVEIVVAPLRVRQFVLTRQRPAAVAFVRAPDRSPPRLARLQQLYGLTAAEARVAQQLAVGVSVADLADSLEVSVATARTHIRRLLDKTGAKSLSDLTRRLASLPPIR